MLLALAETAAEDDALGLEDLDELAVGVKLVHTLSVVALHVAAMSAGMQVEHGLQAEELWKWCAG